MIGLATHTPSISAARSRLALSAAVFATSTVLIAPAKTVALAVAAVATGYTLLLLLILLPSSLLSFLLLVLESSAGLPSATVVAGICAITVALALAVHVTSRRAELDQHALVSAIIRRDAGGALEYQYSMRIWVAANCHAWATS